MKLSLAPFAAILLAASLLPAQGAAAAAIRSDRPSFSTGPEVLDAGIFQLEAGSRFTGGSTPSSGFEVLQRFGLVPGLEFRALSPIDISASPASSMALGLKAQFLSGYLFSLGALGLVELGSQGRIAPQAALLATLGLPAGFSLTLNAGPSWRTSGADWSAAALLGYDSGNLWQAYAEVARTPQSSGGGMSMAADAGLQVLVTEDLVWDLALVKGLGPEVADWGVTSGFSIRWGY